MPVLAEATAMIASYLTAERDLGRIAAGADVDALALALIGAAHMLFAGWQDMPVPDEAVTNVVTAVVGAVQEPPP